MQTELISSTDPAYFLIVGLAAAYACLALIVLFSWMSSRSQERDQKTHQSFSASGDRQDMDRGEMKALRTELANWMDLSNAATTRMRQMKFEMDQLRGRLEELEQNFDEHVATPHAEVSMFQPVSDESPLSLYDRAGPAHPGTEGLRSKQDAELGLVYLDRPETPDDLTQIWGIGAVNQTRLQENGIFFFHQIGQWTPEIITKFDEVLMFKGRIARETWVEQAQRFEAKKHREAA